MKKLIFGLLVTASLISCNNESAKREQLVNDNVKFYGHVWDVAIVEGRVNILDTAYSADVVYILCRKLKVQQMQKHIMQTM